MRTTIQATIIIEELHKLQHATNAELWKEVQARLPAITLPSLHRTTARLIETGKIGSRLSRNGQAVLDARPEAHSHFFCAACTDGIKDIVIDEALIDSLQRQIGSDIIDNSIVVHGTCKNCQGRQQT